MAAEDDGGSAPKAPFEAARRGIAGRDDDGGSYDADDAEAAPDPRPWFLRDPGALAKRLVLGEILGGPRGRRGPRDQGPGHAPPAAKRR